MMRLASVKQAAIAIIAACLISDVVSVSCVLDLPIRIDCIRIKASNQDNCYQCRPCHKSTALTGRCYQLGLSNVDCPTVPAHLFNGGSRNELVSPACSHIMLFGLASCFTSSASHDGP